MPIAIDLLEEMKRRGLSDSAHVTSLVILLMRSASSFADAFDAYKTVRERTQISFQAKGYAAILHTFTTLKFDNRTIPPWQDYFQIVKDMQEDGSPVLPHLYTNMLRQMARMAARAKPSDPDHIPALQKIVHAARDVQHLLTISTNANATATTVTLDTPFWNQLMDTYQRAGAFEDARRIWDKLVREGRVDATSVSVIFDACGRAGAGRTAVQLFASLRASGFRFNLRNWHAWLECLCRLGQLDDAARYFCLEMGNGPHGVPPDEQGARILLKFANQRGVGHEVCMRIQRFLPALWEKLPPDVVRGPY
jgi:pentatricopeptide repeat protein